MKFQLCMRDEYRQTSILATDESVEKLDKLAKDKVNSENVDNALTVDDKKRNWESYYVTYFPEKDLGGKWYYAGQSGHGKNMAIFCNEDGEVSKHVIPTGIPEGCKLLAYLGEIDGEDWYASDRKNNIVTDLNSPELEGKNVYFIVAVGA